MAQAVLYWQRAGQRAVQRSAHVEAVAHLTRGLALLTMLPDTLERARQELDVATGSGGCVGRDQRVCSTRSGRGLCPGA